jgi:hypothetical protein
MVRRLAVAVAVLSIVFQSCTNAVIVPLDDPNSINPDAKYVVVTTDGSKFIAKGLQVDDDSISFWSEKKHYSFARSEIESVQKLEYDKSRTFLALTLVAAAVTGLILLIGDFVEELPGGGS